MRFITACKAFWKILISADYAAEWEQLAAKMQTELKPETHETPQAESTIAGDAVYTLVLLQREGRLVDFLQEDIAAYSDAQVGAAVRQIHDKCRKVLVENFGVESVRSETEGTQVEVMDDFDPQELRIIGKPGESPPYKGELKHHGWRATKVDFPQRHEKLDPALICPAEVEVSE